MSSDLKVGIIVYFVVSLFRILRSIQTLLVVCLIVNFHVLVSNIKVILVLSQGKLHIFVFVFVGGRRKVSLLFGLRLNNCIPKPKVARLKIFIALISEIVVGLRLIAMKKLGVRCEICGKLRFITNLEFSTLFGLIRVVDFEVIFGVKLVVVLGLVTNRVFSEVKRRFFEFISHALQNPFLKRSVS